MNAPESFTEALSRIFEREKRYKRHAYEAVQQAVSYTTQHIRKDTETSGHISGEELLAGLRDMLLELYGPLAADVVKSWGIRNSADIGNIVFLLVEEGVLGKSEDDSIENFSNGPEILTALNESFENAPAVPERLSPIDDPEENSN